MSELLLQLKKEHQQQLESLKNQHAELTKKGEEIKSQMTAVEGAFMAKKQSLEQIEAMIKAHEATQTGRELELSQTEVPPAGGQDVDSPDYKKSKKPKKQSAPRPAVVPNEAVLPH